MPQLEGPRRSGFPWGISGSSRGTTTSSGVMTLTTEFRSGGLFYGWASDAYTRFFRADRTLGTQSTFYAYKWLTPNGSTARFRVELVKFGNNANSVATAEYVHSTATSVSGLEFDYWIMGNP